MGSGLYFKPDQLPPRYKSQVENQLNASKLMASLGFGAENMARTPHIESVARKVNSAVGKLSKSVEVPFKPSKPIAPEPKNLRAYKMTKPEMEFNRDVLGGKGLFEAITLRCPSGNRYTPDWFYYDGDTPVLVEVKGNFRLGSEGRARTAFLEAASFFSRLFRFVWAVREKSGEWNLKMVIQEGDSTPDGQQITND